MKDVPKPARNGNIPRQILDYLNLPGQGAAKIDANMTHPEVVAARKRIIADQKDHL